MGEAERAARDGRRRAWTRWWRSVVAHEIRSRPTRGTWAVTGVVLAAMITTTIVRTGEPTYPGPGLVALILVAWGALAVRTVRPVLVLLLVVLVETCIIVFLAVPDSVARLSEGMGAFQPVPLASMLAAYTVAERTPRRVGWGAGIGSGTVLLVAGLAAHGETTALTDLVVLNLVVSATALGTVRAGRREARLREIRERESATQAAVLDERVRIARELHDVLAHNLTLVNAQAGVAEYLLANQPQAAAEALRDITRHTSRAIDELRATIGLLRSDDPAARAADAVADAETRPVPGVDAIDELVASHRATGARVELTTSGVPAELDQHAALAGYRIVQEALTNAAKHAPGRPVAVSLHWSAGELRLGVVNGRPVPGERRTRAPGTGHGLIGMRERALAAGGSLRAGADPDGRFEVRATLPVRGDAAQTDPAGSGDPPAGRELTEGERP